MIPYFTSYFGNFFIKQRSKQNSVIQTKELYLESKEIYWNVPVVHAIFRQ